MKKIDICRTADILEKSDDILILTHANPDGDTLGSAAALFLALREKGKRARIENSDGIPQKYNYLFGAMDFDSFEEKLIVAVDVATRTLLGNSFDEKYGDKVDLCIDHHGSNTGYASKTLLDADKSSNCEIILEVIKHMGVNITTDIANAVYTGLSTDTGCFRFANTTAHSHEIAAQMIAAGAQNVMINKLMFETKSFEYLELERLGLESLTMHFGGKAAIVTLTQDIFRKSGYLSQECDGICAIPRQIEGVLIGATIRERPDGSYKVSVRTNEPYNAADICRKLGGGGHPGAAGFEMYAPIDKVKTALLTEMEKYLNNSK